MILTEQQQKQKDKYNYISTKKMSKIGWLRLRQHSLGGSDAGAIMKMPGSFKTPVDVYLSKREPIEDEGEENIYMKAGRMLEPVIADYWAEETGMKLLNDNKMRFHPEHDCISVNLDRIIVSNDERGPGVLEAKTANGHYRKTWEFDLPLTYYAQIQHELLVTKYLWAECALLIDGREFERVPIAPNPDFMATMLQAELDFWNNHVKMWNPPPATEVDDIYKIFGDIPEGLRLEADEALADKITELDHLKTQFKPLDKDIKALAKEIKLLAGDKSYIVSGETVLATFRQQASRSAFDEKRFREENPDLYEKYAGTQRGNRPLLIK